MDKRNILQGGCEVCGPSQSGPDPLPTPGPIAVKSLLVERPVTKKSVDAGTVPIEPPNQEALAKAKKLIESGPFIVIGSNHIVFSGMDAFVGIHMLTNALQQQLAAMLHPST